MSRFLSSFMIGPAITIFLIFLHEGFIFKLPTGAFLLKWAAVFAIQILLILGIWRLETRISNLLSENKNLLQKIEGQ